MTNRRILYGYTIKNGAIHIKQGEATIVQRLYTLYMEGLSYQVLSDELNRQGTPYSPESPIWNKHKVKRVLQNVRYIGHGDYPAIVDEATYSLVQEIIKHKAGERKNVVESPPAQTAMSPTDVTYVPSAEVLRLTNLAHHGIDHPDNPNEVIDLILQGIAARYDCLVAVSEYETTDHPTKVS